MSAGQLACAARVQTAASGSGSGSYGVHVAPLHFLPTFLPFSLSVNSFTPARVVKVLSRSTATPTRTRVNVIPLPAAAGLTSGYAVALHPGQHTDDILGEAGLMSTDIAALPSCGAI